MFHKMPINNETTFIKEKTAIPPGAGTPVVVAMSGGVDSSVAAALLHEHGYRVIGITLNLWDYDSSGGNLNYNSGCCSIDTIGDARAVCHKLGVPHYVLNLRDEFNAAVQENFIAEYFIGRTPNPCVRCNTYIKWGALLHRVEDLGAEFLATGHYCQIRFDAGSGRWQLLRAVDHNKDQSYALWGVKQAALARTYFPLGGLRKPETRMLARDLGLKTSEKPESFEICFIPDNDYRRYLRHRAPERVEAMRDGDFVNNDGSVLGQHQGAAFYTVGQRKKLGLAAGKPVFVTNIDAATNTITIGSQDDLLQRTFDANSVNWISEYCPADGRKIFCKIRYRDPGAPATLWHAEESKARVRFDEPQRAITPGQSTVFYDGDVVIGGGVIDSVAASEEELLTSEVTVD